MMEDESADVEIFILEDGLQGKISLKRIYFLLS